MGRGKWLYYGGYFEPEEFGESREKYKKYLRSKQFIDIGDYNVISKKLYSPDVELMLFLALDALFVLVKTDFFDKKHEEDAILETFDAVFVDWVQPRQKSIILVESDEAGRYVDVVGLKIKTEQFLYALVVVTKR
ncbi:MAG: hypothetical protein LBQ02_04540 [Candidatus Nomurabacteria bacterium]|jgi:hypothetical protein|nr:hypothetical protein [Candidatus Nomurabacteria bacterium]